MKVEKREKSDTGFRERKTDVKVAVEVEAGLSLSRFHRCCFDSSLLKKEKRERIKLFVAF